MVFFTLKTRQMLKSVYTTPGTFENGFSNSSENASNVFRPDSTLRWRSLKLKRNNHRLLWTCVDRRPNGRNRSVFQIFCSPAQCERLLKYLEISQETERKDSKSI